MNICGMHDEIITLATDLQAIRYKLFENVDGIYDVNSLEREVDLLASRIVTMAEKAKEAGQKMEDRLKGYREAIEGLGFKRDTWGDNG